MRAAQSLLLISALILVLMPAGCDNVSSLFGGGGTVTPVYDPYHGSTGLAMSFLPNSPPRNAYTGHQIKVGLTISNEGAFDITDAALVLSYNQADFAVDNPTRTVSLMGRSPTVQQGDRDFFYWDATVKDIPTDIADGYASDIKVIAYYRYQTSAVVDVCIDPTIYYGSVESKTCSPTTAVSLQNQGAPVAVTAVSQELIPQDRKSGDVQYKIQIKNLRPKGIVYGGGSPTSPGEMNTLKLSAALSDQTLSCDPSTVKLEKGAGETTCFGHYEHEGEYTSPLHVRLDYIYKDETDQSVSVILMRAPKV